MSTAPDRAAFHYHLWNHGLVSDFDLGELDRPAADATLDPLSIQRVSRSDCAPPAAPVLFENRTENGDVWSTTWRIADGYFVHFPGLCAFRIFPARMHIDCAPEPGAADSSVAHMILDHAIPRLLSLKPGFVVFHACAIQIEEQVIAVIGQSGQGKSTLASWFASRGFPLLTDDCLVVRRVGDAGPWLAQPSYGSVRLWPDSVDALGIEQSNLREFAGYSSKRRTGREVDFSFASAGAPLTACFVLPEPAGIGAPREHSGPPAVRRLSINDAFLSLAGAVFRVDVENPQINRREFEVLTSLTSSVRFWSLEYERKYSWLPAVQNVIIKAIQNEG